MDIKSPLEAVYYSGPVPANVRSLTILGVVFDRVYFPGVYLPSADLDLDALDREVGRLRDMEGRSLDALKLAGMLSFLRFRRLLEGFCEFTGTKSDVFGNVDDVSTNVVHQIHEALHGPYPSGWKPIFETGVNKAVPGIDDAICFPGDYYYQAGALAYSSRYSIPIISDTQYIPVPVLGAPLKNDADAIVTALSLECATFALQPLAVLHPIDLMNFRRENLPLLEKFRHEMRRHAVELNRMISSTDPSITEKEVKFYVDTVIRAELRELTESVTRSTRTAADRVGDIAEIGAEFSLSYATGSLGSAIVGALCKLGVLFARETLSLDWRRDRQLNSNLYYLLKISEISGG